MTNSTNNNQTLVQKLLDAMQAIISKYGLELMQRYPNDLLVHDKATLEVMAVPGAKIAWMVGHSHTHNVPLGLHSEENQNVLALTNLCNDDRFFVLNIGNSDNFTLKEIDRKAFAALSNLRCHYVPQDINKSDFWVLRNNHKVGHIEIATVGTWQDREYAATITPVAGISGLDRAALKMWASHAITKMAGTLFRRDSLTWAEPVQIQQAA